ncbi:MAG: hypothetical protein V4636_12900 [Pseudomonadota bacterium]
MSKHKNEDGGGGGTAVTAPSTLAPGVYTPEMVRARRIGTYPDHSGHTRRREVGDVFVIFKAEHFSSEWMIRQKPGDPMPVEAPRVIPQTTAPIRRRADPFPPMQ